MLDELAIYNLAVKHPRTVELVHEVEKIARADTLAEVRENLAMLVINEVVDYETYEQILMMLPKQ